MLFRYFLKQFLIFFTLSFIGLIPLFASCDMLARLASLPISFHILQLFIYMLPLAALFALPIATCFAVGFTVGNLYSRDETLLLHFFPKARTKLLGAVVIFSVICAAAYIPLVLNWAPNSYWFGKQFLVHAAQEQIEHLPAKKFHSFSSHGTIFFKDKTFTPQGTVRFEDILLMIKEKDGKKYLVTARQGEINKERLLLTQGTIYNNPATDNYVIASFGVLEVAFQELFFHKENGKVIKPIKFRSAAELWTNEDADPESNKEWHKRMLQILWQLLFPLLMMWGMMLLGRTKSNVLLSVVLSGSFFLFSYIHANMAYFMTKNLLMLFVFYLIPFGVALGMYRQFRKKWSY